MDTHICKLFILQRKQQFTKSSLQAVAADIPGRTPQQIMHYWRNKMDATIRKGKWTTEEDQMLQQVPCGSSYLDSQKYQSMHRGAPLVGYLLETVFPAHFEFFVNENLYCELFKGVIF